MRYVSYVSKSPRRRLIAQLSQVLGLGFIGYELYKMWAHPTAHSVIGYVLLLLFAGGYTLHLLRSLPKARHLLHLEVDVSSEGLHHLAPGEPKIIRWPDVRAAEVVTSNGRRGAIRLQTAAGPYVLAAQLVPDSPDAPVLHSSLVGSDFWLYPDGRREDWSTRTTFAYRILEQYRPDLLTGPQTRLSRL
jgi:hypothetical protein